MMHRTRQQPDFWARRGIQPLQAGLLYRCPCWATLSGTAQAVCQVCKQPAKIEVR